jgi:heme exporter protein C
MMLRQGIEDPERRARFGAVYTILGFVAVPITFISIRLLRTIHPVVIGEGAGSGDGSFAMTGDMQLAFFFSLFAFTIIFADLLWHRIRMGKLMARVEQLRLKVSA